MGALYCVGDLKRDPNLENYPDILLLLDPPKSLESMTLQSLWD